MSQERIGSEGKDYSQGAGSEPPLLQLHGTRHLYTYNAVHATASSAGRACNTSRGKHTSAMHASLALGHRVTHQP
jgi:hypothetical protein